MLHGRLIDYCICITILYGIFKLLKNRKRRIKKNKDLFIVNYNKIVNRACTIFRHETNNGYIRIRKIHVIKHLRVHFKTLGSFS